ncbi:hypothetical protein [uncultured Mediterranean phage uvDeep-CGR2-KM18-C269]|nr:hypothetical protein [uncultured Mediterranean phage uvDeep-CGR2-KM18-C269]
MRNKVIKLNPKKKVAIECFATNPQMTYVDIAEIVGVHQETIMNWRKDPLFIDAIYERYMVEFGAELPAVLNAMVREACAGNVQAGRLILEHSGKLVKNISIKIDSPFEKFLNSSDSNGRITSKENIDSIEAEFEIVDLPKRDKSNDSPNTRKKKEKKQLNESIYKENKKAKYLKAKRERYALRKRADAVDLEHLPAGRANKSVRTAWLEELEKRERQLDAL